MESHRFDALSRALATAGSRRRLLGLLSALPLASWLLGTDDSAAKPGRSRHRHHPKRQRHRRTRERHATHHEACIPTGQACPSKKPRGKKGRKLGCNACCQGRFVTEASGKKVCGCQPNGGSCTSETASSCCSGFCHGSTCQAAPCSAAIPCPQCQSCNATTGLCEVVADGTTCDDGNACTTATCQAGACVGTPVSNYTICAGSGVSTSICCNGTCWDGCCGRDGEPSACLGFITSRAYRGDLKGSSATGLDGADAKCQERANVAPGGPLPGTYKAWLSSGTGPNECPACGRFRHSAQPYTLVDGATRIAANWAALTSGTLEHGIDQSDEGVWSIKIVWTDTTADGTLWDATQTCSSWTDSTNASTGLTGNSGSSDANWTATAVPPYPCDRDDFRLYCFQQM